MDSQVFFTVWILTAIGLCLCQNHQIVGPLKGAVGGTIVFRLINTPTATPQGFSWSFGSTPICNAIAGNVLIYGTYKHRATVDGTTATLVLSNLTLSDPGEYSLTIRIDGVDSITATTLSVTKNATIVQFEHERIPNSLTPSCLKAGTNSVRLTCEATGNDTIRKWMKDGKTLSPSNRITFTEDNRTMSINPVENEDKGEYQCQVSNPISNVSAYRTLTVADLCVEDYIGIIIGVILIVAALGVAGRYIYNKTRERNKDMDGGGSNQVTGE